MWIDVTFLDYPDPIHWAVLVYFGGCEHHCRGCSNPTLQKYIPTTISYEDIEKYGKRARTNKIVLSGGDPLHPLNRAIAQNLILDLPHYDFCVYTGYSVEQVKQMGVKGFKFLKCGTFEYSRLSCSPGKTEEKFTLASTNQQLFDGDFTLLSYEGVYEYP